MKFIHTADWQLGRNFTMVQEKADLLRQARIDVIKKVLALAVKEKVDFIIAAGDLLEDNRISPSSVETMAHLVSASTVPVYLLPGNHDPLTQDSPYIRKPDLFKGSSIVLSTNEPIAVKGGTLFPCPARSRSGIDDPTGWIPRRDKDDGIRIGIAHGSVGTPAIADFPIDPKASSLRELDYLALGHWHGTKQIDDYTWYCGTPEPTTFGEFPGHALLVEINQPQSKPKIRQVAIATYKWETIEVELHSETDLNRLIKNISDLKNPATLLNVRATGTLQQHELAELERLSGDDFFFFRLQSDVQLAKQLPTYRHPLLKHMAMQLHEQALAGGDDSAAARRALSQMALFVRHAEFPGEDS